MSPPSLRTPWPTRLRSQRLELRPFATSDHDAWLRGFTSRLPPQHIYDGGPHQEHDTPRTWFRSLCARHRKLWATDKCYILGIFSRADGQHLGHVDIYVIERGDRDWANLGYAVHNTAQGEGVASEACSMAITWAFKILQLHRLEAVIRVDNLPSLGVARRLGLEPEGIRHQFERSGAQWMDQKVFAAIKGRWMRPSLSASPMTTSESSPRKTTRRT